MKTLHFGTLIDAPREAVWETMLASDSYKVWTAPFMEGSYFEGSWAKGERIRFLDPSGSGVSSVIAENRPHEFLSIKHVGMIRNGVEDTDSDEVRSWAGAFENYSLSVAGGSTEVKIAIDITPQYEEYMASAWPKALAKLKEICERPARR